MKETSNKSYVVVMCVSVLCLIVIVVSVTYAYFTPKIQGEGKEIKLSAGLVNLNISETKIDINNLAPIRDTTSSTKAQKNEFTISRTSNSTLNACYSLYLVVEEVGDLLKDDKYSKFLKYELDYIGKEGTSKTLSFDLSTYGNYTPDENGKVKLPLLQNEELNSTKTSRDYVLRVWLSYSDTEDQTILLTSTSDKKTFKAKIMASGASGSCPTE